MPPKFVVANLGKSWNRLCPKADLEDAEQGQKMANTACSGRFAYGSAPLTPTVSRLTLSQ